MRYPDNLSWYGLEEERVGRVREVEQWKRFVGRFIRN
jgi:hypothetical protein